MNKGDNILGCFVSGPALYFDADEETREAARIKAELFRNYIWGEFGICERLKELKYTNYGEDLRLALFQFYLLPLIEELAVLKEIERYRRKERAIGLPIIVHDHNFFEKSDPDRRKFLKKAMLEKLDLLAGVVARNKLDTDIKSLRADVETILF
jgi:hypothetical protein